jgi:hypothetical protein
MSQQARNALVSKQAEIPAVKAYVAGKLGTA